jgi:hypothetical protein
MFLLLEPIPPRHDVVEMLKDDPTHDSLIRWTHVVGVGFDNLETRATSSQLLGFGVSLSARDVYRFVAFIGVKEEAPTQNQPCSPVVPQFDGSREKFIAL